MKLYRQVNADMNIVSAYDPASVTINGQSYLESLVVMPGTLLIAWASRRGVDELSDADMVLIRDLAPALVLLGTGARQRFPAPSVLRPLIEAGIGVEIMDTGSACRTYNILASEGRLVAAALLIEPKV